jgi:hypothetical protein
MSTYAANTQVSVDKSKAEIERTLQRYGATQFAYGWDMYKAMIGFHHEGRAIRITLKLPDRDIFKKSPSGKRERRPEAALKAWEQACRQSWRALALVIKAKLEAVEAGIASFEDEFLAYTVLPNGQTAGGWLGPQIDKALQKGRMPKLLPAEVMSSD